MGEFLLGVNYWPRRSAMYMWERFDLGEIREDAARIQALGLRAIRFFIMWESFQPQPDRLDEAMLRRMDGVMNTFAALNLLAMPAFFTGHMSGVNFVPEWALDRSRPNGRFRTFTRGGEVPYGCGDFYSGPIFEASRLHVRTIGERYRDHPALLAWDLGNEFSNVRAPATPREADEWAKRLSEDLRETSDAAVTAGNHGEDLTQDRNFRFEGFCKPLLCAVMHGYSVYSDFARGRLDSDVVPFLCQVMQSLSGKPVLFDEFGNPTCPPGTVSPFDRVPLPGEAAQQAADLPPNAAPYACLTEDEMAGYASQVLEKLHRAGALGAFWWCWADYAQSLASTPPFDRAPHELRFGMIREDGSEKPVAEVFRRFAAEHRSVAATPEPIASENAWWAALPGGVKAAYDAYLATHG